ncbi:MAG: Omp28-related outer membrane protein [Candidatus Kapaibacteriota bacterium]
MKQLSTFSFLFIFIFTITLNSQFVRKVIVEEATNASCGPCASQNPTFQKWLSNHLDRVIPVIYHAWWPGANDPMYTYNKTMNQTRIQYYGITGVPNGRVNGKIAPSSGSWYQGAVADTVALNAQLNAESFYSFLSVMITGFTYNPNGNGTIKIEVTSIKPITNVYLRVVICEEHHYYENAGSNGEKNFYYVARQMLPDARGTLITLNENETRTFEFPFSVDSSFTDDLYAVAFVQNDNTKEILQGTWTKNFPFKEPDFALFVLEQNLVNVGKQSDSFELETLILNNTNNSATFNLSIEGKENLPSDWTATIENNLTAVTVDPQTKKSVKVKLTVGETPYASDLKLKVSLLDGSYTETSSSLVIYHKGINRLHILAGETSHSIQPIIDEGLASGYMFNINEKDFMTFSNSFASLKTIVWDGSRSGAFSAASANIILDALNKKQNILICGGSITSGMVSNGILPYFGISFINYCSEGYGQAPNPVTLAGVPNDPITGDFGDKIQGYLISYLLPLYKIVNPNTTTPIMTFAKSADSICAVKVELSNSRAIILGMNPYIIANENLRKTLITRSLLWLERRLSEVLIENANVDDIQVVPNPTNSTAFLKFNLEKPASYFKIDIFDTYGRQINTNHDGSLISIGEQSFKISLTNFPNGLYFIRVNLDGKTKILPIIKVNYD